MSQTIKVRVDAGGNVTLPVGQSFGGQEISITYDIAPSSSPASPGRSAVRQPRVTTTADEYRRFIDDLYGSYDGELPEPNDPPAMPEKIF